MSRNSKRYEFIAYAKICSSKLAYKCVVYTNNGRDTEGMMLKLRLVRSYIKALESYAGIKRKVYFSKDECCGALICVKNCLNSKEICNIVNKLKLICKSC